MDRPLHLRFMLGVWEVVRVLGEDTQMWGECANSTQKGALPGMTLFFPSSSLEQKNMEWNSIIREHAIVTKDILEATDGFK